MRDYVDPWAHNMNGNSNQMGVGQMSTLGGNGNFNLGNGNMNNMGNNAGNQNSGGNFGNEMDNKQSTQVTIPKDVSYFSHTHSFCLIYLKEFTLRD